MFKANDMQAASDGAVPADFEAMAKAAPSAIIAPAVAAADDAGGPSNPTTVADQAGGPVQSAPTPVGGEFLVNTYTAGTQQFSSIAALASGGFVVTWSSNGQDGSNFGIYGQRYTAAGVADGSEFRVNTYTAGIQQFSSIAALTDGGFVVTWSSFGQDGDGYGSYGQRYTAAGATDGSEFRINSYTTNSQLYASVAALADGGFVVTWSSLFQDGSGTGIYGQRYTAAGAADGSEFRINTFVVNDQGIPTIAALAGGGFVVTWSSEVQDGGTYGIYGQRYTAAGLADGSEFRVNTYTTNAQFVSSVTALAGGGFVVTWSSDGQDGSGYGIYGQRYTDAGAADGSEFRVNTYTINAQHVSSVAALAGGGFVVTWSSEGQDGSLSGIYGKRYTAAGVADGSEFLLNETTSGSQTQFVWPRQGVTQLVGGQLVATWHGNGTGDAIGVFARQFSLVPNVAPVADLNGAGAGIDTAASWTEDSVGVKLALAVTLSDTDSANLTGATVTIASGFVAGDILRMSGGLNGTTASGITFGYNTGTGVLTLSGTASVADYQAALATLAFKSNSDNPGTARDITVVVNDGAASSAAAHINITVAPINDAPVNTVPGNEAELSGGTIVFSVANANALTVSDPDAGTNDIRVKVDTDHGTLTLASTAGLTVTGNGTGLVIVKGTIADINTALDGLTYQGEAGYTGPATVTLTTNDRGNSGSGGPLIDSDSVAIIWQSLSQAVPNMVLEDGAAGEIDLSGLASLGSVGGDLAWFGIMAANSSPEADLVLGEPMDFAIRHWEFDGHSSAGSDFML